LLLGLILLAGAAGLVAAWQEQEKKEEPQAELPKPLVIPEEEKNRKNPTEATAESLVIRRKLFSSHCVMCHGKKGDGEEPADPSPPRQARARDDRQGWRLDARA